MDTDTYLSRKNQCFAKNGHIRKMNKSTAKKVARRWSSLIRKSRLQWIGQAMRMMRKNTPLIRKTLRYALTPFKRVALATWLTIVGEDFIDLQLSFDKAMEMTSS